MLHSKRVAVVVPAHNEARFVETTLRTVPAWVDHLIVVDDASTDGTAEVSEQMGLPHLLLIRHPQRTGAGGAILSGYRRALDLGAEIVAVMAGDGQMHPADLRGLASPIARGEADYVKGNRMNHPRLGERMPPARRVGNRWLSKLTSWALGCPIQDAQCGYTAISADLLGALDLNRMWLGYGYPNDWLGRILASGARVQELSVEPVYGSEESGVGWRHALVVIPLLVARTWFRRAWKKHIVLRTSNRTLRSS